MSSKKDAKTLISESGYFDASWYVETYPDVLSSGLNALDHYLKLGQMLKRDPSISFSSRLYLEANPDVAAAGLDPLQHFLRSIERGEKARAVFPSYARLPDTSNATAHTLKERVDTLELENNFLILELNKAKAQITNT